MAPKLVLVPKEPVKKPEEEDYDPDDEWHGWKPGDEAKKPNIPPPEPDIDDEWRD